MRFWLILERRLINGQKFRQYASTGLFRNKDWRKDGQNIVGASEEITFTGSSENSQNVPTR